MLHQRKEGITHALGNVVPVVTLLGKLVLER